MSDSSEEIFIKNKKEHIQKMSEEFKLKLSEIAESDNSPLFKAVQASVISRQHFSSIRQVISWSYIDSCNAKKSGH